MNADMFTDGKKDYLAILGPPDEMAPAIPDYVNASVIIGELNLSQSKYLNQKFNNSLIL